MTTPPEGNAQTPAENLPAGDGEGKSTFSRDAFGQVTVGRSKIVLFPGFLEMTRSLLVVLTIALFILTFIVQPFRIPSESMERTLLVGDFLLVNKVAFAPARALGMADPLPSDRERRRGGVSISRPIRRSTW